MTEPAHTAGRAGRVPGAGGSLTVRVVALMAVSCLLGVVTALLGAPFFLWLILRLRREP